MQKKFSALDKFAEGSRLMESFSYCMEEQSKEYLRLKLEVTENEKRVIKLRSRCEQKVLESEEFKKKTEAIKEQLNTVLVTLEYEKKISEWLCSLERKQKESLEVVESNLAAVKVQIDQKRRNEMAEMKKFCSQYSIKNQIILQRKSREISPCDLEKLGNERNSVKIELEQLELQVAEMTSSMQSRDALLLRLNELSNEVKVLEKCINAWKIRVEKQRAEKTTPVHVKDG